MNRADRLISGNARALKRYAFAVIAMIMAALSIASAWAENFSNFALTTLATSIGQNDTTLTVASTTNFPSSAPFRLTIQDSAATTPEIVMVTAISGDTYTVTRGLEGSTQSGHSAGAQVGQFVTAGVITNLYATSPANAPVVYIPSSLCDGATDQTSVFQGIINSAPSTGERLEFPTGTCVAFSADLVFNNKNIYVEGQGSGDGVLIPGTRIVTDSATADGIQVPASGVSFHHLMLQNVLGLNGAYMSTTGTQRIYNTTQVPTAGAGIHYTYINAQAFPQPGDNISLEDVTVQGYWNNIEFDSGYFWNMTNSHNYDPVNYGMQVNNELTADSGDQHVTGNTFSMLQSSRNPAAAIEYESGGGLRLVNNKIVGSGGSTPLFLTSYTGMTNASGGTIGSAGQWQFGVLGKIGNLSTIATGGPFIIGNSMENFSSGYSIYLDVGGNQATNTSTLYGITIEGNEFQNGDISIGPKNASNGTVWGDVIIKGNILKSSYNGIALYNISGGIVDDNDIQGPGGISLLGAACYNLGTSGGSCGCSEVLVDSHNRFSAANDNHYVFNNGTVTHVGNLTQNEYDFQREIPAYSVNTTQGLYRFLVPEFYAGTFEVNINGQMFSVGGQSAHGLFTWSRGTSAVTVAQVGTTSGTDVNAISISQSTLTGTNFTVFIDTVTVSGEIRIAFQSSKTFYVGNVSVKFTGPLTSVKKGV